VVKQYIVDVADFLVLIVVDVQPDEL